MKRVLLAAPLLFAFSSPAQATGGFICRTAGANQIEVAVGFGHVPGSPLFAARLIDRGRPVPVRHAQWWLDNAELRLLLTDPDAKRREVIIKATRNGHVYDGSLWRGGVQRWVRCRES